MRHNHVVDEMVKVFLLVDNEMGYSSRMVDLAAMNRKSDVIGRGCFESVLPDVSRDEKPTDYVKHHQQRKGFSF